MTPEEARSLLGVTPGATAEEIKHAVRKLSVRYHPDRHVGATPDLLELAQREFARVRQAEEVLLASDGQPESCAGDDHDAAYSQGCELIASEDSADQSRAFQLLLHAALAGHADAQAWVGHCLERGIGTPMNSAEGLKWNLAAAMQENPAAQLAAGMQYWEGRGAPKDADTAIEWIERAAFNGHRAAQMSMANYHRTIMEQLAAKRPFGEADLSQHHHHQNQAAHWQRLAAEQGVAEAQFELAVRLKVDATTDAQLIEAWKWLVAAAQSGFPRAQWLAGQAFSEFGGSTWRRATTDYMVAREQFEQAVAQDFLPAAFSLAQLLEAGKGGPEDASRAAKLYERVALEGDEYEASLAKARLALLCYAGRGVPKDLRKAKELSKEAALELYKEIGLNDDTRKFGFSKDMDGGEARFLFGLLCARGLGVSKDKSKARSYLRSALEQGHPQAKAELDALRRWW